MEGIDKVAERLKELRHAKVSRIPSAKKVTQKEIAEAIHVDWRTYSNWEGDRAKPATIYLIKLAKYFNTTVDYIVGYDANPFQTPYLTWRLDRPIVDSAHRQAVEVWKRLAEGETQEATVRDLGIREVGFNKFLRDVILQGFVKILRVETNEALSQKLKEKHKLLDARILNGSPSDIIFQLELLGYLASRYLVEYINQARYRAPNLSLGLAGGYTVSRAIAYIQRGELGKIAVYPLAVHPVTHAVGVSANTVVGQLAYTHYGYEVEGHSLNASCFAEQEKDEFAQHILDKAEGVDIILAGVGTLEFIETGLLRDIIGVPERIKELRGEKQVVGDFVFHLINQCGEFIDSDIQKKICNIRREIPNKLVKLRKPVIVIASGKEKTNAVHAVLTGGHANVIITDQATAEGLLEK